MTQVSEFIFSLMLGLTKGAEVAAGLSNQHLFAGLLASQEGLSTSMGPDIPQLFSSGWLSKKKQHILVPIWATLVAVVYQLGPGKDKTQPKELGFGGATPICSTETAGMQTQYTHASGLVHDPKSLFFLAVHRYRNFANLGDSSTYALT